MVCFLHHGVQYKYLISLGLRKIICLTNLDRHKSRNTYQKRREELALIPTMRGSSFPQLCTDLLNKFITNRKITKKLSKNEIFTY